MPSLSVRKLDDETMSRLRIRARHGVPMEEEARRILPHDERAARHYGNLMGACQERGRPMSVPDGRIAAIALAHPLMAATRKVTDFAHCGVDPVDPFDAQK
jgi:predicted nucleic acid-binding protein